MPTKLKKTSDERMLKRVIKFLKDAGSLLLRETEFIKLDRRLEVSNRWKESIIKRSL